MEKIESGKDKIEKVKNTLPDNKKSWEDQTPLDVGLITMLGLPNLDQQYWQPWKVRVLLNSWRKSITLWEETKESIIDIMELEDTSLTNVENLKIKSRCSYRKGICKDI